MPYSNFWPAMRAMSCTILIANFAPATYPITITAQRLSREPLLRPGPAWSEFALFNPAAIQIGKKTVLLFRAQDRSHTSRIGYAESNDGLHFAVRPDPVLSPETDYEKGGGVEDPRVVQINGTYYLTYTAYDLHSAQLCLATSTDLIHWQRRGIIMPAYRGTWNTQWTKSGAIVPQKINGKWWMYYLGTRKDADGQARDYMGLASSSDLLHWSDATRQARSRAPSRSFRFARHGAGTRCPSSRKLAYFSSTTAPMTILYMDPVGFCLINTIPPEYSPEPIGHSSLPRSGGKKTGTFRTSFFSKELFRNLTR